MQGLTLFNLNLTHLLDAFLETAVPMIAGLAEVVGLFIIITSLAKATFYYVRATFFNDHRDFHHEMSSGQTFLLQNLESVVPLAATFALRALMSMLLHWEMEGGHRPANAKEKDKSGSPKDGKNG